VLFTPGKLSSGIPRSTLDISSWLVVWEVVAILHDVVIGARIGDVAAETSDYNTHQFSEF